MSERTEAVEREFFQRALHTAQVMRDTARRSMEVGATTHLMSTLMRMHSDFYRDYNQATYEAVVADRLETYRADTECQPLPHPDNQ